MDNAIALGIKPLQIDVATPLLTAAKIRQSNLEEQQNRMTMQRQALNDTARGLAPLAGTPEFGQRVQEAGMQLRRDGILDDAGVQRFTTAVSSPLTLQSILAQTTDPALAQRQTEATQRAAEHKASFGLQQQQFGLSQQQFAEQQKQHEFENLKPVKIGETLSGEIFGIRDPSAPGGYRILDAKVLRAAGQQPSAEPGTQPTVPGAMTPAQEAAHVKAGRNPDAIRGLDPEERALVEKVVNYDLNPNSLSARKGGSREKILAAASVFDPAYDQKNFAAFSAGLKAFGASKEGGIVRSFNVGLEHLDQLGELGKALNNGDMPKINELKNWVKTNLGGAEVTNFNGLKTVVGAEIVKAIVGAGGGVEERAAAARTVAAASSPAQLEGIIKTYREAMGAQLGGLQRQYEQSTGRKDFDRLLSPAAIRSRDSHTTTAPAGVGGSTVPQGAIDYLKANPKTAEQFDATFGAGSAAKILGVVK